MIDKSIELSVWGNVYKCNFPITHEFLTINAMKSKLSQNEMDAFKYLESEGLIASIVVETIAHFDTMFPKLKDDLNVKSFLMLPLDKLIELCWIYTEKYKPWYKEILDTISLKKNEAVSA